MRRLPVMILSLLILLAACSPRMIPVPVTEPAATSTHIPVDLSPAQIAAVQALSESLGIPVEQIKLVSAEAVEWPDSCLGAPRPNVMCAQMITPGFKIVLGADGRQYEYHTNQDGSIIVPATLALSWQREGGIAGFCDDLTVYLSGEVYGSSCKSGESVAALKETLSADELTQFNDWLTQYGQVSLDASDPQGVADRMQLALSLYGSGEQQPDKSEQQVMFSFAQSLYAKINQ
jgi:hypothetical protein